jgi:hypothetical protein
VLASRWDCLYLLVQAGQERALCPEFKHFQHLVLFLQCATL